MKARPRLAGEARPGCLGRCHWLRRGGASRAPAAPLVIVGTELGKGNGIGKGLGEGASGLAASAPLTDAQPCNCASRCASRCLSSCSFAPSPGTTFPTSPRSPHRKRPHGPRRKWPLPFPTDSVSRQPTPEAAWRPYRKRPFLSPRTRFSGIPRGTRGPRWRRGAAPGRGSFLLRGSCNSCGPQCDSSTATSTASGAGRDSGRESGRQRGSTGRERGGAA